MAEISIDRSTFPQEGGSFKISITKDTGTTWGSVTIPSAAWYEVGEMKDISPFLYTVDVAVEENTSGASRTMPIGVMIDGQSELFNITQESAGALAANIVSSTAGNVAASGGQVTVDVQAVGGVDSLSTASVSGGSSYCHLVSTTHGVTSGGVTATRFVFSFDQNTGSSSRSATLSFSVSDGGNTASATLTKSQNGAAVQTGSLAVSDVNVNASDTGASAVISMTDIQTGTLAVDTTVFGWVSGAAIQVSGGSYVLALSFPANTGAARTETVQISATDNWGNHLVASMVLSQGASGATHSISVDWRTNLGSDGVLDYEGGTEQALVSYTGTFTGSASVSYGTLPEGVSVSLPNDAVLYASYTGGNIGESVLVPITISRTGNDSVVYSAQIVLTLQASGVFPIWRDVFGVIPSDEDWEDYELQEDGLLFYSGRAFAYPDESDIKVNISRVVAPYLVGYFKDVDFVSGGTVLGSYTFVRDYSYDKGMDYTQDQWLNRPVNGRIPSGVKMSVDMWGSGPGGAMQVMESGGSLVVNKILQKGLNTGEWVSGVVGQTYSFGSEKYEVVDVCQGVLLKYVNAYGGVDFLLVEGVCKKTDKITRASYEKDAAAGTTDFETADYQASMSAEWRGVTGWLTDSQSMRMKHLVESVEVYMITQDGEEVPVVMRDSSLEYKTFRSGRSLVNYTLQWVESQKKLRR